MHALIVLGGDAPDARLLERCMRSADLVLAADRGLEAFHFAGLTPDMLIGDMDSVAPEVLARYEGKLAEHRLSCIKDDTDGVDALDVAIRRKADRVTFLGALGGRLDHALANLMLLGARAPPWRFRADSRAGRADCARGWIPGIARRERGYGFPPAAGRGARRQPEGLFLPA